MLNDEYYKNVERYLDAIKECIEKTKDLGLSYVYFIKIEFAKLIIRYLIMQ